MRYLVGAAILAVVTAAPAMAQPADPAAAARARMIAADTNKDGKWSLAEWTAAGRGEMGFGFCDTSKDAMVDAAELKICAEKARAMGMTGY